MGVAKNGEIRPFTCPDCGRTFMLPYSGVRKRCLACAKKQKAVWSQRCRDNARLRRANAVEEDEKQRLLRIKTSCLRCHYWRKIGEYSHCAYYITHGVGHRVDHGTEPGGCNSFLPKGTPGAPKIREGIAYGYYTDD